MVDESENKKKVISEWSLALTENMWLKAEELCSVYPLSVGYIALSLLTPLVSLWVNPQTGSETQHSLREKKAFPKTQAWFFLRGAVSL